MCQLLALAFNEPVTPSLSFRGFRHRARGNPHGWGLASFQGVKARISKEPDRADRSDAVESILQEDKRSSTIFIGHVRYASVGNISLENTHPFVQRVKNRDLVLAHNGTLCKDKLRSHGKGHYSPEGDTDSELALCVLADWLIAENVPFNDFARIHDRLQALNEYGDMNLLFSEGEHLFAYHDREGYNGLCHTHRKAPFMKVSLCDEDWSANLPEEKRPTQQGYVIATKPLTRGEDWTEFDPGALMVFKGGRLVYPI